ncbi:hypothetical protein ACQZV8_14615 [Magnetococcales bacterium HHB-1]
MVGAVEQTGNLSGAQQMTTAAGRLDEIIRKNTETVAISRELERLAEHLQQSISVFSLGEEKPA